MVASPSPEALGVSSRRLTLSRDLDLHYVTNDNHGGPALVFLHGVADSWRSWQQNLPRVSNRYAVYALSQRGHGDSSKPACCYRLEDFVQDVADFLDALGLQTATLIGHSMGSAIAYEFALRYPERLERLVLVGWGPAYPSDPSAIARVRELQSYLQTLEQSIDPNFVRAFLVSMTVNPLPPAYLETLVEESLKVPLFVWQQLVAARLTEPVPRRQPLPILTKTLILYGDRDPYLQEGLNRLPVEIKNSVHKIYPAAGHVLHCERPEMFHDDLEKFLASKADKSSDFQI